MKILVCLLHKRQIEQPLIKSKQHRHLIETHHIIMRSLGGSNDTSNLVNLTLREHYVIHELLVKVYNGTQYEQTAIKAWNGMSRKMPNKIKSSRLYAKFRSKYNQIAGQSTRGKICINNGERNRYICPNEEIPIGWHIGMHHTNKGLLNIKNGCKKQTGLIFVTNGIKNKRVPKDAIPDGYYVGRSYKTNAGKIMINDGKRQKFISLNDELPDGFNYGCIPFSDERRQRMKEIHKNMSDETKRQRNQKISKSNKGRSPWSKGRHLTEAHKAAIRKGNQNKIISIERRKRISDFQRGKIKVNNGIKTIYADPNNIPEGFVKGQLHKKKIN